MIFLTWRDENLKHGSPFHLHACKPTRQNCGLGHMPTNGCKWCCFVYSQKFLCSLRPQRFHTSGALRKASTVCRHTHANFSGRASLMRHDLMRSDASTQPGGVLSVICLADALICDICVVRVSMARLWKWILFSLDAVKYSSLTKSSSEPWPPVKHTHTHTHPGHGSTFPMVFHTDFNLKPSPNRSQIHTFICPVGNATVAHFLILSA